MITIRSQLLIKILLATFAILTPQFGVNAASAACTNPPTETAAQAWPSGAASPYSIPYYINPSFSAAAQTAIKAAFAAWSGTNGVSFTQVTSSGSSTYQVNPVALGTGLRGQTAGTGEASGRASAVTSLNTAITNMTALQEVMVHEIGHSFGLNDCKTTNTLCTPGANAMIDPAPSMNDTTYGILAPTACDKNTAAVIQPKAGGGGSGGGGGGTTPPPSCTGTPSCSGATCVNGSWICPIVTCLSGQCTSTGCVPVCTGNETWNPQSCICEIATSPIIIDTDGLGFHLTSLSNGVLFDFFGDGNLQAMSWTAAGSTNGWLALDRNGNGLIDSAKELFGNITDQPSSDDPNGFRALAVFDEPSEGGNNDGVIDAKDTIWPSLRVWIDKNHDGISQVDELFSLEQVGVSGIRLGYTLSRTTDEYGNTFRYKGSLRRKTEDGVNRVIYDVFLLSRPATP